MKRFGLMPHTEKGHALQIARETLEQLTAFGASVVMEKEAATAIGRPDLGEDPRRWGDLDAVIVLGGDGALLRASRLVAPRGTPLLAVNVGWLGFLTELEADELPGALPRLLQGQYTIEERMMLRAEHVHEGGHESSLIALNDAVITRGTFARIIRIQVAVGEETVLDFSGDGIVVATPTGSTGYSLSAGGPIVNPRIPSLVLTPICPHALASRSVVVHPDEPIVVRVKASHPDIMMTVDGQVGRPVASGDEITITRADEPVRLLRLGPDRFYRELRERLGRGMAYQDAKKDGE